MPATKELSATLYRWGNNQPLDILLSYQNAIAGSTNVTYSVSTTYANTQLPFPVKTVRTLTKNDGNGNISLSVFDYNGGYYHIGEREFRGLGATWISIKKLIDFFAEFKT